MHLVAFWSRYRRSYFTSATSRVTFEPPPSAPKRKRYAVVSFFVALQSGGETPNWGDDGEDCPQYELKELQTPRINHSHAARCWHASAVQ